MNLRGAVSPPLYVRLGFVTWIRISGPSIILSTAENGPTVETSSALVRHSYRSDGDDAGGMEPLGVSVVAGSSPEWHWDARKGGGVMFEANKTRIGPEHYTPAGDAGHIIRWVLAAVFSTVLVVSLYVGVTSLF